MKRSDITETVLLDALHRYWGYPALRGTQPETIRSVLSGADTLALMPTGGGKSLTYQLPGLVTDGLCIVVTPLVALMKDQVDGLRRRGIPAVAIHSGMSARNIDITLDNCVYGDVKFLYVSPERIAGEVFAARVAKMNVNLLAVDEAHCISQWGYDFRPDYLQIAAMRVLVDAPVIALTATATPEVARDIADKLARPAGAAVPESSPGASGGLRVQDAGTPAQASGACRGFTILKSGFERPNLSYIVRRCEDKAGQLSFGQVGATRMLCNDMTTEHAVLAALDKVAGYEGSEKELTLTDGDGNALLTLAKRPAATLASLQGKWDITAVYGQAVADIEATDQAPFLEFNAEEKKLHGNAGCNIVNGGFTQKEGLPASLEFGQLISTMMAGPGMTLERQVLDAMNNVKSFVVKDNQTAALLDENGEEVLTLKKP